MTRRTLYLPLMIAAAALLACVAALSAAPREAGAAFPGQNGAIVSAREPSSDEPWSLYSRDPDTGTLTRLTAHDPGSEELDEDPAVSPDGTRVAFARANLFDEGPGSHFSGIYAVDADGSGAQEGAQPRKIADDPALIEYGPAWSPDGRKIAFSARPADAAVEQRAAATEVHVVDADGTDRRRITHNALGEENLAWSPDGTEMAFTGSGDADGDGVVDARGVYVMGSDGSGARRIAEGAQPSWSPDGSRLAYACGAFPEGAICTANPDGSDQRRIVTDRFEDDPDVLRVHDFNPAWSPDGTRIAFERNLRTVHYNGYDVYAMDPDGSDLDEVEGCCYRSHDPDWGPAPQSPPADEADPAVTRPRPAPGSSTRDRTPTVRAVVRDGSDELGRPDVRLYVDGAPKAFAYDPATDRLSRTTGRLSHGRHRVRVVAEDAAGNVASRAWSFRVVRGR